MFEAQPVFVMMAAVAGLFVIPILLKLAMAFGLYTIVREREAQVYTLFGKDLQRNEFPILIVLCAVALLGCSKSEEANPKSIFIGMWSDPVHTDLSVGMEIGKGKEIGHVGVFADEEYGSIDLYFDGQKVGTHSQGGVVMTSTGGLAEVQGTSSKKLVLIGMEEIGDELFRITEIEEIETGPVNLTIDHRSK